MHLRLRFKYFAFQGLAGGGNEETKTMKMLCNQSICVIHHRCPIFLDY